MRSKRGDQEAPRVLLPLVYDELRRLAPTNFRTHAECVSPIASPGIAASRMDIDPPPPSAVM
jgi:hypothetical protein